DRQNEERNHKGARRPKPLFFDDMFTQVFKAERVDRVEVRAAVPAFQCDRLDLLAAGRTFLGIAPGGSRCFGRRGLIALGRVFTPVSGAAADVGPALSMMNLVARGTGDHRLIRPHARLTNRTGRALTARVRQGGRDNPALTGNDQFGLAPWAAKRL